jgi:bacteriocin-like protein
MNKQSENKPSLQDEPNKPNSAKDELNEQDLNQVSGGRSKDRDQEQPGNEMAR